MRPHQYVCKVMVPKKSTSGTPGHLALCSLVEQFSYSVVSLATQSHLPSLLPGPGARADP